jgi:tRNA-modifying protein YgfZ
MQVSDSINYMKMVNKSCLFPTEYAVVAMGGKDSVDFLHRMSTNNIKEIREDTPVGTVLTNEKAKVIDFIQVIAKDGTLYLIVESGDSKKVISWLEHFIITDDVVLTDISSLCKVYLAVGPESDKIVHSIRNQYEKKSVPATQEKFAPAFIQGPFQRHKSYYLILPAEGGMLPDLFALENGISNNEVLETLRIEEGVPAWGREISNSRNPLESGLRSFISFSKGCYIGQEVIARIDTYDKLQKELRGFVFKQILPPDFQGGPILAGSDTVGDCTSWTWSAVLKHYIGLGILRRDASGILTVHGTPQVNGGYPITLHDIPFIP